MHYSKFQKLKNTCMFTYLSLSNLYILHVWGTYFYLLCCKSGLEINAFSKYLAYVWILIEFNFLMFYWINPKFSNSKTFPMPVRLAVGAEQLENSWTDFPKIWFRQSASVLFTVGKTDGTWTWQSTWISALHFSCLSMDLVSNHIK